ncbi:MAG: hypothetical protein PHN42_06155 [Bacilli bacterium]|nr:hypothetical protein [Bacilli bacterium]
MIFIFILKNNIKLISIIFILISFIYIGNLTYSKYKDQVNGTTNIKIASWNIIVNSESIAGKNSLASDIEPVFTGNEYVSEGVLAPGVSGYYDITIDATNVDVSFSYSITCSNSVESTIDDLIITDYIVNPDVNSTTTSYTGPITGTASYNDIIKIRVYIKWNDDELASMNNLADTDAILDANAKALITNVITFNQIKNS